MFRSASLLTAFLLLASAAFADEVLVVLDKIILPDKLLVAVLVDGLVIL